MAVVFFDFDSTIVKRETLDDAIAEALAEHPEKEQLVREVERLTRLGMEGRMGFLDSVRRRLEVIPLSKQLLEKCGRAMLQEVSDGMPELFEWLRSRNHDTHIVSGGFTENIAPVAEMLRVPEDRRHTNRFIYFSDGHVYGLDESSLLLTDEGKTPVLRSMRQKYRREIFIMVGDGMNDYRAYESGAANIFCGFGGNVVREAVKTKAPHFFYSAHELLSFFQHEL
jgi:HAD superfamily phosphoserine phosphatase-like hydrolase